MEYEFDSMLSLRNDNRTERVIRFKDLGLLSIDESSPSFRIINFTDKKEIIARCFDVK